MPAEGAMQTRLRLPYGASSLRNVIAAAYAALRGPARDALEGLDLRRAPASGGGGRPLGLRQVHAARARGRPAGAGRGRGGEGAAAAPRRLRLHAPARPAPPLARRARRTPRWRSSARACRAPRRAGAPSRCSRASAWASSSARDRPRCRAACASALPSYARCCPGAPCSARRALRRARLDHPRGDAGVAGGGAGRPSRAPSCS